MSDNLELLSKEQLITLLRKSLAYGREVAQLLEGMVEEKEDRDAKSD